MTNSVTKEHCEPLIEKGWLVSFWDALHRLDEGMMCTRQVPPEHLSILSQQVAIIPVMARRSVKGLERDLDFIVLYGLFYLCLPNTS